MIQYYIANNYITVKLDYRNGVVITEMHQEVLLQVSVIEMHMYILKNRLLGFPWHIMKKEFTVFSYYALQLIIQPQLGKMNQRHQIMYDYKICIQAGTCQEFLNNLRKGHLGYIKNKEN